MNDLFDSKGKIRWYHYIGHLGYYIPYYIKAFFKKPFAETKKDLNMGLLEFGVMGIANGILTIYTPYV